MTLPTPETEKALDFLRSYRPEGWITLTSIVPDGGGRVESVTVSMDELAQVDRAPTGKTNSSGLPSAMHSSTSIQL